MLRVRLLAVPTLLCVAGCLPISLDVNPKGEMLIPRQEGFFLYTARTGKVTRVPYDEQGQPVYARFVGAGDDLLLVTRTKKDFQTETRFDVMPRAGGKPRTLFKGDRDVSAAELSPDGKQLALVIHAGYSEDQMPEIHIVDLKTSVARLLLKKASVIRWMPDSKALLAIKVDEKAKNVGNYVGQIATIDAADAKLVARARAYGGTHELLAVSPDCKRMLFTARSASTADGKLDTESFEPALYELDVAASRLRKVDTIDRKLASARYSPSGNKVLFVAEQKNAFLRERSDLLVADAALKGYTAIAHDAFTPLANIGDNICYPGWLDEDTIYYFTTVSVYGQTGRALRMRHVRADGEDNRDVQPDMDLAVTNLAEARALKLKQ